MFLVGSQLRQCFQIFTDEIHDICFFKSVKSMKNLNSDDGFSIVASMKNRIPELTRMRNHIVDGEAFKISTNAEKG